MICIERISAMNQLNRFHNRLVILWQDVHVDQVVVGRLRNHLLGSGCYRTSFQVDLFHLRDVDCWIDNLNYWPCYKMTLTLDRLLGAYWTFILWFRKWLRLLTINVHLRTRSVFRVQISNKLRWLWTSHIVVLNVQFLLNWLIALLGWLHVRWDWFRGKIFSMWCSCLLDVHPRGSVQFTLRRVKRWYLHTLILECPHFEV